MWTIGGVRVFVDSIKPRKDSVHAEIQVLGSTDTIIHHFGSKSVKYTVGGKLVGFDTIDSINNMVDLGNPVVVSGNSGFYKTVYLSNFQYEWLNTISQTFDNSHACDDPVFNFTIEMIEQ